MMESEKVLSETPAEGVESGKRASGDGKDSRAQNSSSEDCSDKAVGIEHTGGSVCVPAIADDFEKGTASDLMVTDIEGVGQSHGEQVMTENPKSDNRCVETETDKCERQKTSILKVNKTAETASDADKIMLENGDADTDVCEKQSPCDLLVIENGEIRSGGVDVVTDSDADSDSHVPYDKGWAWVVVFGCFINHVILIGYLKSSGVVFVELLHHFRGTASHTALLFGLRGGVFSVTGLYVMNVVVPRIGVRRTVLIGGVLMALSAILSSLATDLTSLICIQSLLLGAADAMLLTPGDVLIGVYFRRRRSLAIAISKTGASVGSVAVPPLMEYLIRKYGLQGALLLLGGFCLHAVPAALLLRPVSFFVRRHRQNSQRQPKSQNSDLEAAGESTKSENSLRQNGLGSKDKHQTFQNDISIACSTQNRHGFITMCRSVNDAKKQSLTLLCSHRPPRNCAEGGVSIRGLNGNDRPSGNGTDVPPRQTAQCHRGSSFPDDKGREENPEHCVMDESSVALLAGSDNYTDEHAQTKSVSGDSSQDTGCSEMQKRKSSQELIAKFSASKGAAITIENANFDFQNKGCTGQIEVANLQTNLETHEDTKANSPHSKGTNPVRRVFKSILFPILLLDFSLFRRPVFRLLFFFFAVSTIVNITVDYLPALATEQGMSGQQAALLLSIIGGLDFVCRLVSGLVADLRKVRVSTMIIISCLVLGLANQFMPYMRSFSLFVALAILQGMLGGVTHNLMPTLIIDFVGLENLSKALGFLQLVSGAFVAVFFPFLGHIRDVTGSYVAVYHVIGSGILVAGCLLCCEALARLFSEKNKSTSRTQQKNKLSIVE